MEKVLTACFVFIVSLPGSGLSGKMLLLGQEDGGTFSHP